MVIYMLSHQEESVNYIGQLSLREHNLIKVNSAAGVQDKITAFSFQVFKAQKSKKQIKI